MVKQVTTNESKSCHLELIPVPS